jgi:hypothetical protein
MGKSRGGNNSVPYSEGRGFETQPEGWILRLTSLWFPFS